jgi:hypothetical protein
MGLTSRAGIVPLDLDRICEEMTSIHRRDTFIPTRGM